jgi:hypothetical protein
MPITWFTVLLTIVIGSPPGDPWTTDAAVKMQTAAVSTNPSINVMKSNRTPDETAGAA